jgi:hypothetical protein
MNFIVASIIVLVFITGVGYFYPNATPHSVHRVTLLLILAIVIANRFDILEQNDD